MNHLLRAIFAYRYKRWWLRWYGDPRRLRAPSPFFPEGEAYKIAIEIRIANPPKPRPKS